MHQVFPNPNNNEWITKYNDLVDKIKLNEEYYKEFKKTQPKRKDIDASNYNINNVGIHHIIPKKIDPSLSKDKSNLLYVPFKDHMMLHYFLWKADYHYSLHMLFIAAFARKYNLWEFPNGEEEWKELCKDCAITRKENKIKKE